MVNSNQDALMKLAKAGVTFAVNPIFGSSKLNDTYVQIALIRPTDLPNVDARAVYAYIVGPSEGKQLFFRSTRGVPLECMIDMTPWDSVLQVRVGDTGYAIHRDSTTYNQHLTGRAELSSVTSVPLTEFLEKYQSFHR